MLTTFATIANITASLAVVISLIFIGIQLKQNVHLTRMAAAQTAAMLLSQNYGRVIESADLAELLTRDPDGEPPTESETLRVTNFLSASFRYFEVLHTHQRYNIFEQELWEGTEARLRETLSNQRIRDWWYDSRTFYAASFVRLVDELCEQAAREA